MSDKTGISWTDATWNPIVGCSRVSEGCRNCYAEREAHRLGARTEKYAGLTTVVNGRPVWNGTLRLWEPHLDQPLRWTKPRRIFVNSMSDLFHEEVSDWDIRRIFSVMARASQHTFQVLTKRPARMAAIVTVLAQWFEGDECGWPLENVWLGVSVEDQATADERIPLLLQTPAAVRWVSYEPALGPVDFARWLAPWRWMMDFGRPEEHGIEWIVVGGESGHGARPFDLAWARQTIAQCRAAGVACFIKQIGSMPKLWAPGKWHGSDPAEWPPDLRVQEYPR